MSIDNVQRHYEKYPYPHYSLGASVHPCDTYALNLESLWARFNSILPPPALARRILIAGCGSFSPYPMSIANPLSEIVALDLSRANLRRARIHAALHRCFNIFYEAGNLLDPAAASGRFGFIDCYGVLHHLEDPQAGLCALEQRLAAGGILRLMVYSRDARREAESIRRALRLLKIHDVSGVRKLLKRANRSSRFYRYVAESIEGKYDSGLADALLHPCARTYRIDELLELITAAGLQPLLFAHRDSLPDVPAEILRLRELEKKHAVNTNIVVYLGRSETAHTVQPEGDMLMVNPRLRHYLGPFRLRRVEIAPRLGREHPVIDGKARRFLRRFLAPVPVKSLSAEQQLMVKDYLDALFLIQFNQIP